MADAPQSIEMSEEGIDAVDLLLAQHQLIRTLFSDVLAALGTPSAADSFCELRRLLAVHETAEEEVVHPAIRSSGDEGARIAAELTEEEGRSKDLLSELESMGPEASEFPAGLAQLRELVLSHAAHEESDGFPLLRLEQDADALHRMAQMLRIAEKAAPTHPHPHGPDGAVGNLVVGPFVAVADRVRDALHRTAS